MPERSRSRTSGHNYRELLSRPTSRRDFFLRSGAGIGVVTAGIMLAKAATIDTHSTPPTLHPTPDEETEPAQQYDLLGHRFPFHMEGPFTRSDIFDLHTVDYPADAVALYKPPSLLVTDEVPIDNDMYYLNDDGVVTLRGGAATTISILFRLPNRS